MNASASSSQTILDLKGASGALYRFRHVADPRLLPASGGNFVCVRQDGRAVSIVCCGAVSDLRLAAAPYELAVKEHLADRILVRLNVSVSVRDREHEDLVALHQPPMATADTPQSS